jgi:hypothetical protein
MRATMPSASMYMQLNIIVKAQHFNPLQKKPTGADTAYIQQKRRGD